MGLVKMQEYKSFKFIIVQSKTKIFVNTVRIPGNNIIHLYIEQRITKNFLENFLRKFT